MDLNFKLYNWDQGEWSPNGYSDKFKMTHIETSVLVNIMKFSDSWMPDCGGIDVFFLYTEDNKVL